MGINLPSHLYRFRSVQSPYFEDEIQKTFGNRMLFCTPIDGQNDPYDCRPVIHDSTLKDINLYLKAANKGKSIADQTALEKHYPDKHERKKAEKKLRPGPLAARTLIKAMNLQATGFRNRTKIACLSERWDSILMWSHYTVSHRGICIEYKVHEPTHETVNNTPQPVSYTSDRTKLDTFDLIALVKSQEVQDKAVKDKAERCMSALILEKSIDWKYEKEWRVQSTALAPPGYFAFENLEPVSVILGANATTETRNLLGRILPPSVIIKQVVLDDSQYKLHLIDV